MKYFQFSIYLMAFLVVFAGCEKAMEQKDPQAFNDENAYTTIDHVQLGLNGAYAAFGSCISDIYKTALTSDEVKIGPDNGGSGLITYRYQYGSDNTSGGDVTAGYFGYYAMIDQINRVLANVDKVSGGSTFTKNKIKGELLGLRAIAHFALMQSFCKKYEPSGLGIAVMTSYDNAAKPARNTMSEVISQIETDISAAKGYLGTPTDFIDYEINSVNLTAFQARVALFKRDYTAAKNLATNIISSLNGLAQGDDYRDIWMDKLSIGAQQEVLFRYRTGNSTSLGGLWTSTSGLIPIAPSSKLINEFADNDIRKNTFFDTLEAEIYFVKKHYESDRGARRVDVKYIRLSEMYLIRAEANAMLGDVAAGTADLNTLRTARISGYVDDTFATSAELMEAIIEERYKELCFEGFRFYDLKRTSRPVIRESVDAQADWIKLDSNSYKFVYPIPRSAILSNPNTVQNPGY
jgi:hypothetical protein